MTIPELHTSRLYLHIKFSTDLKKLVTRLKLQFAAEASNIYLKRNFE